MKTVIQAFPNALSQCVNIQKLDYLVLEDNGDDDNDDIGPNEFDEVVPVLAVLRSIHGYSFAPLLFIKRKDKSMHVLSATLVIIGSKYCVPMEFYELLIFQVPSGNAYGFMLEIMPW